MSACKTRFILFFSIVTKPAESHYGHKVFAPCVSKQSVADLIVSADAWVETGAWWVREWILVSGRPDSIWSMELIPAQRADSTYTKSISQTIQARERRLPLLWTRSTCTLQSLFLSKDDECKTLPNFPTSPGPLMIYWDKQKLFSVLVQWMAA